MDANLSIFEFGSSQEAWEGLNEFFFNGENQIIEKGGKRYGPELVCYNIFVFIRKGWVDPEFDFGNNFGYRQQKWRSLVNNYINFNYLDLVKSEIQTKIAKKSSSYNISMQFDNSHGSGKGCLLSLTFSKRINFKHPILTFSLRSSEITKRLLMDFLLVQRIGEYIYGEDEHLTIQMFCPNAYQNGESFVMYDNHKRLKKIDDGIKSDWKDRVKGILKHFKKVNPDTIKYRVHLRSVRQIQKDANGKPISGDKSMRTKELTLFKK